MAFDISKICSDHLREVYDDLKASHARELVAAVFGFKSHAALLYESNYKVDAIQSAAVFIPDVNLINQRKTCLDGLSDSVGDGLEIAQVIAEFLEERALFSGAVWVCEDLGRYIVEEYLPETLDSDMDNELADIIAETNAFFDEVEYDDDVRVDEHADSVVITATGSYYGENDWEGERAFFGDTVDFQVVLELSRIAGRVGFGDIERTVTGEVNTDYFDHDDEPENEPAPVA